MIRRVLPPVTNEVITLVKDTSLASVIGTVEMFTRAKQIVASPNTPGMLALAAAGLFTTSSTTSSPLRWSGGALARLLPVREGPDMNVLTMQDVRKSFGSLEVLKGISLTVGEGEAVSVIGPSGSGKSTLLRCATLLETMDGGSLAYGNDFAATMDAEGKSVYADKAALRRIKSRFGLVFQQFNLFPHYTVLKNVTDAPLTVQKRERGEVR